MSTLDTLLSSTPSRRTNLRQCSILIRSDNIVVRLRFLTNKTQQTKLHVELLQAPPTDTRYSVLLASSHSGLPPAFIQVAQLDPLRDDGILYAKLLKEAGVQTQLHA